MSATPGEETFDLPPSLLDGKVVEGRHGRLFLANDANRVLDQHRGEVRFSEEQLRQWRLLLETRTAWLLQQGIRHFFLIAPNAHSIYPEDLPDGVATASERPVEQLLRHLAAHGMDPGVVYPLETLKAGKDAHAYPKTGSHWSGLGAFLATSGLLQEIARELPIDVPGIDAFEVEELTYIGDLGAKLRPQATSTFVRLTARDPRVHLIEDNRVRNTGRRMTYESGEGPGTLECLVYGDSYAVRVLLFLAQSFRRVTFVHMPNLDFDLVRDLAPDVVVKVMNERFLIAVPVDLPAKTHAELAAEKIAAHDVMPPRGPRRTGRPVTYDLARER